VESDTEYTDAYPVDPPHPGTDREDSGPRPHPVPRRPTRREKSQRIRRSQDSSVWKDTSSLFDDGDTDAQPILTGLAPLVPGAVISGRYRLIDMVSKHGVGTRWSATDESLSRPVYVTAFPLDDNTGNYLEAGRLASGVMDAHFLRILDVDKDADGGFIICERTDGRTLTEILSSKPLSGQEAAWVVREVAVGLASAHASQQYHCRIDPTKIHITTGGNVKISGLRVDLALTPRHSDRELSRTHMEAMDVVGCGGLLYACLTGTWPGSAEVGLPKAPRHDGGLQPPGQVRPGTSVALDKLTGRILSLKDPDHLATAQEVAEALSATLGSQDPTHSLIDRVSSAEEAPRSQVAAQQGPAQRPRILGVSDKTTASENPDAVTDDVEPAHTPETRTPISGDDSVTVEVTAPAKDSPQEHDQTTDDQPGAGKKRIARDKPVKKNDTAVPLRAPIAPDKAQTWSRVFLVLVSLVVLALVSSLIIGFYHSARDQKAATPGSGLTQREIVDAIDFDPKEDGGSGGETPEELIYAYDKDPSTKWTTEVYDTKKLKEERGFEFEGLYIPGKKPGVGVVFDFGQAVEISQVSITIDLKPITARVYVPQGDAASVQKPDLSTYKNWSPSTPPVHLTQDTTTLDFKKVTTRYALVYISELPEISEGVIQADLAEVSFSG